MREKPTWNDLPPRSKRNARLFFAFCLLLVIAANYFAIRYFWPWFVKWCVAQ
ncbi:MAG: hypothetical protein IJV24_03160 [Prevotella sp.]|nr:hypothetical protein [Prevotella sp.]